MDNRRKIGFESNFLQLLYRTHLEAEQLGLNSISTFHFFSMLVYDDNTYIAEFFYFTGIDWEKIELGLNKQLYLKGHKTEEVVPLTLSTVENETFVINIDRSLYEIMLNAAGSSSESRINEISFMITLFCGNTPKEIVSFLRKIHINPYLVRRYFEGIVAEMASNMSYNDDETHNEDYEEDDSDDDDDDEDNTEDDFPILSRKKERNNQFYEIPETLKSCLTYIIADVKNESPILGREKETEAIMKVLLKSKKRNCILVGKPGVGKTAIMEHLAYKIAKGECAEELKNKKILMLDVNGIVAGTMYRGMAEERFQELANFLDSTSDIILYIDEIHNVLGAGTTSGNSLDLANSLKPILARENVSVVGATTTEEYDLHFARDKAFKRRFETIMVDVPKYNEVFPMLKMQIRNLRRIHKVSITQPVINFIIKIASCFNAETSNPDVTLDLIDKSMVSAKMQGFKVVTKEVVLSNFTEEYKRYSEMSTELKTSVAYHEVGHYLVRRYVNTNSLKINVLAISIIPAEDHLGLTVFDTSNYNDSLWGYKEIVDEIAMELGGRVAEKMYTGQYSSGASGDLDMATENARSMLLKYGLIPDFSMRNFEKDMDDDARKELNDEIDKIIKEAYELAEKILTEHKSILENLSEALVKNGILVDTEIEEICKDHDKKQKSL